MKRLEFGRLLLVGFGGLADQAAQTEAVALGEVGRDRDPLPAFLKQGFGFCLELPGYQPIGQRWVSVTGSRETLSLSLSLSTSEPATKDPTFLSLSLKSPTRVGTSRRVQLVRRHIGLD